LTRNFAVGGDSKGVRLRYNRKNTGPVHAPRGGGSQSPTKEILKPSGGNHRGGRAWNAPIRGQLDQKQKAKGEIRTHTRKKSKKKKKKEETRI